MKRIHFILQGKGGVGKTFIASLLAQHYIENSKQVLCLDTDPVNASFSGYKALNAQRVDLMEGIELNVRKFDKMIGQLLEEKNDIIVDNGAASFLPLSSYMLENNIVSLLTEKGNEVVIHTVVTGGQGLRDTLTGFSKLVDTMPEQAKIVVWLNEYFGPIVSEDGKIFEEMKAYTKHKDRVSGVVRIARKTHSTFGQDMEMMLQRQVTFAEVNQTPEFELMAKQRLAMVKNELFDQMSQMSVAV